MDQRLAVCCDQFAGHVAEFAEASWSLRVDGGQDGVLVTCLTCDGAVKGMRFCPWCGKRFEAVVGFSVSDPISVEEARIQAIIDVDKDDEDAARGSAEADDAQAAWEKANPE